MEPFTFLDFLSKLLPDTSNDGKEQTPTVEDQIDIQADTTATQPQQTVSQNQDAIIAFLEMHDKRAKNIKK